MISAKLRNRLIIFKKKINILKLNNKTISGVLGFCLDAHTENYRG